MEKKEHTTEEALNATAFAKFVSGPGGRQARTVLTVLGTVGHYSHGSRKNVLCVTFVS
jgi:hypothetical protein